MIKRIAEPNWADYLMRFAENHQGAHVRMYAENDFDGKKLIGQGQLIAFEGDCSGDIVDSIKVVVGGEGENPDNVFHYVKSPVNITAKEDETGVTERIILEGSDKIKTTVEVEED